MKTEEEIDVLYGEYCDGASFGDEFSKGVCYALEWVLK